MVFNKQHGGRSATPITRYSSTQEISAGTQKAGRIAYKGVRDLYTDSGVRVQMPLHGFPAALPRNKKTPAILLIKEAGVMLCRIRNLLSEIGF
jgi:hypothetical protein